MPSPTGSSVLSQGQTRTSQFHGKAPAQGTPEDQLNPTAQDVPDSPIRLQDHFLACQVCGVAVRIDSEEDMIPMEASAYAEESEPIKAPQNPIRAIEDHPRVTMSFTLCATCRKADELAEQLSGDPATRNPWGRQLLGGAFDALLFLNPKLITSGEVANLDHLSAKALVRHLGQLGLQARWATRDEVDPQTCNPHRFAHVKIGQRAELRTGYALWIRERAARHASAIKISPPPVTDVRSGSAQLIIIQAGCLICGVATQTMPAVEVAQHGRMTVAREIWRPLRTHATQLGGGQSALELSGYLCKVCAGAVDHVHSIGPSALERSLTSHLCPDLVGKLDGWNQVTMSGLVGWAALVARAQQGSSSGPPAPKPNAVAFEHVGDLSEVRKQLRARLGG
jgi:hypothetical protein